MTADTGKKESGVEAKSPLAMFRQAPWETLQLRLTMYAVMKVQKLRWRTAEGLPRGMLPQDIALGAVQKTFEGLVTSGSGRGVRRWDPEKEPDLLEFLKSVVDSDVSSLVNLEEHRLTNYSPDVSPEDAASVLQGSIDTASSGRGKRKDAEAMLSERQEALASERAYRAILDELERQCATDPDELSVLRACRTLSEGDQPIKPAAVARLAGVDDERVRNARRRIERKTRSIRARFMENAEREQSAAEPGLRAGETQAGQHAKDKAL